MSARAPRVNRINSPVQRFGNPHMWSLPLSFWPDTLPPGQLISTRRSLTYTSLEVNASAATFGEPP